MSDVDCNNVQCIVCGKRKQYGVNIHFFKFPHDLERCRAWVKAIGIRDLLFMSIDELREQVVCSTHFDPACINPKGNRLHKVAIPSQIYTPLPDSLLIDFPKTKSYAEAPVMHNFRDLTSAYNASNNIDRDKATTNPMDADPVINYDRPLMNSLETLIHNEKYAVKKPAGILNTISVPLLTYSSSLERGTVFAATDPGCSFELPFVPFIEKDHKEYKARSSKNVSNKATTGLLYSGYTADSTLTTSAGTAEWVKATKKYANFNTHSKLMKGIDDTLETNAVSAKQRSNSTDDMLIHKTTSHGYETSKNAIQRNVSIGLKTLITTHGLRANKVSLNANTTQHSSLKPNIKTIYSRFKAIKQYTNTKATAQIHKNAINVINSFISNTGNLEHQYTTDSTFASRKLDHTYEATDSLYSDASVKTNETMEEANETIKDENETMEDANETVEDANVTVEDRNETVEDGNETIEDANETVEDGNETIEDANETVEDGNETMEDGNENETMEDANETVEYANETVEDVTETVEDGNETIEDADETVEDSNKTMEEGNETVDSAHSKTIKISLDPSSQTLDYAYELTSDTLTVENAESSKDSDLLFVPYSQYTATATPDSTSAHTGDGTFDYGLPLMNCIGTVFQGSLNSNIKSEDEESDDEDAIDVPLMKCFKTLEHTSNI